MTILLYDNYKTTLHIFHCCVLFIRVISYHIFSNILGTKFFFQKCSYFDKEGRWENKIKMSNVPNWNVPFYGRRVGVEWKRDKVPNFTLFYFEVIPLLIFISFEAKARPYTKEESFGNIHIPDKAPLWHVFWPDVEKIVLLDL